MDTLFYVVYMTLKKCKKKCKKKQTNKQNKTKQNNNNKKTQTFCEHSLSKRFFQGCPLPPPPSPLAYWWFSNFEWLHNSYIHYIR